MNSEEYKSLPRIKRLAIFLLVIGPQQASLIIKSLDRTQREAIIREVSEIDVVDESLQRAVIQEFSGFLAESLSALRGGKEAAITFFEHALGVEEAEEFTAQICPPKVLQEIRSQFDGMKATQIWSALSEEDSQVLAYVLSTIDSGKAAEVLSIMEADKASDVFIRISQLEATPAHLLPRVAGNVLGSVPKEASQSRVALGGAYRSAEILKAFTRERGNELLSVVESVDENLSKAISKEMFSFKDLVDVSSDALQRIMREVDSSLLVVAMKLSSTELIEKIYAALSKRGGEALKEELDMQGNVRLSEVEQAQDAVMDVVKKLETDGEIVLGGEEDDYV
jgi:flagellar motor switch protein FliG